MTNILESKESFLEFLQQSKDKQDRELEEARQKLALYKDKKDRTQDDENWIVALNSTIFDLEYATPQLSRMIATLQEVN